MGFKIRSKAEYDYIAEHLDKLKKVQEYLLSAPSGPLFPFYEGIARQFTASLHNIQLKLESWDYRQKIRAEKTEWNKTRRPGDVFVPSKPPIPYEKLREKKNKKPRKPYKKELDRVSQIKIYESTMGFTQPK